MAGFLPQTAAYGNGRHARARIPSRIGRFEHRIVLRPHLHLLHQCCDGGAFDNVCLFINMFLMFFMAGCVGEGWRNSMLTWNLVWAFVLIDLAVHWGIKRARYSNLEHDDRAFMLRTAIVLGIHVVIVLAALVFLLAVGLFLVYFFQHDRMLDHHRQAVGIGFMLLTAWLVFVLGNITVGLNLLPEANAPTLRAGLYFSAGLAAFLASTLVMFRYNKSSFGLSGGLLGSRLIACAVIVGVSVVPGLSTVLILMCDAVVVWVALGIDYAFYRLRQRDLEGVKVEENA